MAQTSAADVRLVVARHGTSSANVDRVAKGPAHRGRTPSDSPARQILAVSARSATAEAGLRVSRSVSRRCGSKA